MNELRLVPPELFSFVIGIITDDESILRKRFDAPFPDRGILRNAIGCQSKGGD